MEGETRKVVASSSLPIEGRVAIVTGASRGIGRAIATHLHALGARVIINYASNSTKADLLAAELNAASSSSSSSSTDDQPRAIAVRANISDPDQVKLLFDQAEQGFGSNVSILVNCAGVSDPKYPHLSETTVRDFDDTFNVNTKGAFLCSREAANRLVRGGGGRIIMITTSLVAGLFPGYSAYAASKAAVETMTKILAKELKGTGITANCVAPGPVATELFYAGKTEETVKRMADANPLGRIGDPQDISQLVDFLATDAGEWVNGQVIRANGRMSVRMAAPGADVATGTIEKGGVKIVRNPPETTLSELGVRNWPKWGCPPSKFPWTYSEKETCYILEGKVKIYPDGSDEIVEVGAGDLVVFPKGMSCTWDVSLAIDKHYNFE